MYLDLDSPRFTPQVAPQFTPAPDPAPRRDPLWSVLVPFFNERALLAATIRSLAAQSRPFRLVLVDNGSTDGGAEIARAACIFYGLDYLLLIERVPGKVAALRSGFRHVHTRYVATCDADTFYPPHYLAAAELTLRQPGCVVAGAFFVAPGAAPAAVDAQADAMARAARLLPRQCHTGGAGQAFETEALRMAGGFDARRWNYVLEDHEIIHRVMKFGAMRYARDLWCAPSPRQRDRASIRWTLVERLMYSATAPWAGDWFFYRFLRSRLQHRQLLSHHIRERQFQDDGAPFAALAA